MEETKQSFWNTIIFRIICPKDLAKSQETLLDVNNVNGEFILRFAFTFQWKCDK